MISDEMHFRYFLDASKDFSNDDTVWCVALEDNHDRRVDALYFPDADADNVILESEYSLSSEEMHRFSMAAFCYLAVILK